MAATSFPPPYWCPLPWCNKKTEKLSCVGYNDQRGVPVPCESDEDSRVCAACSICLSCNRSNKIFIHGTEEEKKVRTRELEVRRDMFEKWLKSKRMTRNAIECERCGDVIESTHRYDSKNCKCGLVFIDGGLSYIHTSRIGVILRTEYTENGVKLPPEPDDPKRWKWTPEMDKLIEAGGDDA